MDLRERPLPDLVSDSDTDRLTEAIETALETGTATVAVAFEGGAQTPYELALRRVEHPDTALVVTGEQSSRRAGQSPCRTSDDAHETNGYRDLSWLMADTQSLSRSAQLDRLLEFGCEWFGLASGVVTRMDADGEWAVESGVGSAFDEGPGDGLETAVSEWTRRVTDETDMAGVRHNGTGVAVRSTVDGFEADRESIGCAIGAAVELDDGDTGVVCLFDRDSRSVPFSAADRELVTLLGQWATTLLQQREAERERRWKERAIETAPIGLTISDPAQPDNPVVYANEGFETVTGYRPEETVGRNCRFLQGEQTDPEPVATLRSAVEDETAATVELRNYRRDGTPFWNHVRIAPVENEAGEVTHFVGFQQDVTERTETERKLSTLMSNIPGMVYRARNEPGWPLEFVSDGCVDLTGYESAALVDGDVEWADLVCGREDDIRALIQSALADREPFQVTYAIETADGERRWVTEHGRGVFDEDGDIEALEGVVIDSTDRVESERKLERTRQLLSQAQRLANVGAWELDLTTEPYDLKWSDGVCRIHGVPTDTEVELQDGIEFYTPAAREKLEPAIDRAIEDGESYDLELQLRRADGELRWVRAIADPVVEDGEVVTIRGSIQDITAQKEREHALESLHETARGLLQAESTESVARSVVETATDVLDVHGVAVYLIDSETNAFEPVAVTDGFSTACDGTRSIPLGNDDCVLWNAFVDDSETILDTSVVDRSALFGDDVSGGLVVPIGDHGLFVFVGQETINPDRRRLVETLAATTEAAFDRLETEANLRDRDAELERQNSRLKRQIGVNEIIRSIDQSLVRATSREAVERTVCDRLAATDDIAFAWIGTLDANETAVDPRAWDGDGEGYLDTVTLETDVDVPEPAVRTACSGTSTVVSNVVAELQSEPWRKVALAHDLSSCLCVPIAFDEYAYGVLAVYGTEAETFGDLERAVFEELGENIANTITALQTRHALHADTLLELTLQFEEATCLFAQIARETGGTVEYEGVATHSADETRLFVTTEGTTAPAVVDVLESLPTVSDYRVISDHPPDRDGETADRCLFEATLVGRELVSRLLRHGANPRSIVATETDLEAVVDVSPTTDVREFVEMFAQTAPTVDLVGKRTVERAMHTRGELVESLFEPLTDRQLEVLKTAYFAGFFEWPRTSTGEDIAAMLDVSQPTINRHLRVGTQRLLAQLFGTESHAIVDESDARPDA